MEKRSRRLAESVTYLRESWYIMLSHHPLQPTAVECLAGTKSFQSLLLQLVSSTNIFTGLKPTVMPPSSKDVDADAHPLHA